METSAYPLVSGVRGMVVDCERGLELSAERVYDSNSFDDLIILKVFGV